jgi:hypothetical protein
MATRRLTDPIEPMDLPNMRANGVRSLDVQCHNCRHLLTIQNSRFRWGMLSLAAWTLRVIRWNRASCAADGRRMLTICASCSRAHWAAGSAMTSRFPLCRTHHRALHRHGDEAAWWTSVNLDPAIIAQRLWQQTRLEGAPDNRSIPASEGAPVVGDSKDEKG